LQHPNIEINSEEGRNQNKEIKTEIKNEIIPNEGKTKKNNLVIIEKKHL